MMHASVKRLYQVTILVGCVGFLLFLSLASPMIHDSADFGMFNSGWNGCSDLTLQTYQTGKLLPTFTYNKTTLTPTQKSLTTVQSPPTNTSILIIGPRAPFTSSEIEYMKSFLYHGGLLFLADDFGTSNTLLRGINATSRFSHQLLLDLSFEKNASFVTIFTIMNHTHPLTIDVSGMLLNFPSSLITTKNTTILAQSSRVSWLDINMNGKDDTKEPNGPFTVYAVESYGDGEIILCSGPSLFINSMKEYLNNPQVVNNLLTYALANRSTIIIDEGHRTVDFNYQVGYVFPSLLSDPLKISILLLAVILFLIFFTSYPKTLYHTGIMRFIQLFKKPPSHSSKNTEELLAEMMNQHPNWNKAKLERIIKGMKRYEKTTKN